ncbi:hypothetical protein BO94DRAFT_460734 [Aspergillus sclerotioniger CBS 115572]|uniref:Zn(2)-C6 fungal-type domain-containing protein n=1 Tax=Aspergillus sclerotioniger CBS 115572 TaxID=1450535 RepID=A0A317X866_9EURO|nr:hypothetical protein BO94DRAFT_460734 [Aspergillus sclerotioniger CBS 115572]PWY93098.1 hypothetical protein BO94DRAFT_460734 [Aspergillus sclerotioniger CBS 115572]
MEPANGVLAQRRPRVERGRSRNGCQSCVAKRVKCDEKHPCCSRCTRLGSACEWVRPRPSLATRRRGFGPIKYRQANHWTPKPILPKFMENVRDGVTHTGEDEGSPGLSSLSSSCTTSPLRSGFKWDLSATGCLPPSALDRSIASPQNLASLDFIAPIWLTAVTPLFLVDATDEGPSLGSNDGQAVSFHQSVLAPLKSTRSPPLSAHALFLRHAWDKRIALHFLLAVSHSEIAIYQGQGARPTAESRFHLQKGVELLVQVWNPVTLSDHFEVMLSFLYIYMFWMRRDRLAPSRLSALSSTVLAYVRLYGLDGLCTDEEIVSAPQNVNAVPDKVLLSRVFIYLYDRDGFCSFFNCGGSFASYVHENPEASRKIWRLSRTAFLCFPRDSICFDLNATPEVEEAAVLQVYFELIRIHHRINSYSQKSSIENEAMPIQRQLDQLRKERSSLFQQVATLGDDGHSPSLIELVTVSLFYAVCIYLCRSRSPALGEQPVPPEVQTALTGLITTAHRTISRGSVQLLERFQWSLLILGLETNDPIHWDWVGKNITDAAIREVFNVCLRVKKQSGGSISIATLRQLVGGEV